MLACLLIALLIPHPLWAHPSYKLSVVSLVWQGHHFCTGVSVDEHAGLFLTAGHCVEDGEPFQVDGHFARLVAYDYERDLAAFIVPGYRVAEIPLAYREVKHGDPVLIAGYPISHQFTYQQMKAFPVQLNQDVSRLWTEQGYPPSWTSVTILVFADEQSGLLNGMSGGPIISHGRVVGIVVGQKPVWREDGTQMAGLGIGVSHQALSTFLGLE